VLLDCRSQTVVAEHQKGPPVAITAGLSGTGSGMLADQPFRPDNAGEWMWFQKSPPGKCPQRAKSRVQLQTGCSPVRGRSNAYGDDNSPTKLCKKPAGEGGLNAKYNLDLGNAFRMRDPS
jgi:hypothetical protein